MDYDPRWYLDFGILPPSPPASPSLSDLLGTPDWLRRPPAAPSLLDFLPPPPPDPRPKVFVSYHHKGDQAWCDHFRKSFSTELRVFTDRSLGERIRSDDPEYVNRTIREDRIVGSSVTVVLCGAETWKRKYVDWEIRSTLHHGKGLVGIVLPTAVTDHQGRRLVPDRLFANVHTGYALWIDWTDDPAILQQALREARRRARKCKAMIDNSAEKMGRNRP